jgi:hypothetical protein
MPNWVMNELTCIFQTPEEYNAFKMKANTEGLFNSFIPMPTVLEGTISPHHKPEDFIARVNRNKGTNFLTLEGIAFGSDDTWDANFAKGLIQNLKAFEATGYHEWYKWNLDNWGVKWEASNCKSKELSDFNTIVFSFDTPWGCPEYFVRELSRLYPTSTFEMVSGSIENDCHYEFTCEDGKFEETCSYETFKEAVEDGKWGGWNEWKHLLQEDDDEEAVEG